MIWHDILEYYVIIDIHTLQTFRFDIKRDKELPMRCMIKKRIDFACAILENKLFVIGGCNENLDILNSVEMWGFPINTLNIFET